MVWEEGCRKAPSYPITETRQAIRGPLDDIPSPEPHVGRPLVLAAPTALRRTGRTVEWCVVLPNSFQHLSFELVPWLHHSIVLLLSAFSLTWFEAIGSIGNSMCRHSVEQLIVESLTAS